MYNLGKYKFLIFFLIECFYFQQFFGRGNPFFQTIHSWSLYCCRLYRALNLFNILQNLHSFLCRKSLCQNWSVLGAQTSIQIPPDFCTVQFCHSRELLDNVYVSTGFKFLQLRVHCGKIVNSSSLRQLSPLTRDTRDHLVYINKNMLGCPFRGFIKPVKYILFRTGLDS